MPTLQYDDTFGYANGTVLVGAAGLPYAYLASPIYPADAGIVVEGGSPWGGATAAAFNAAIADVLLGQDDPVALHFQWNGATPGSTWIALGWRCQPSTGYHYQARLSTNNPGGGFALQLNRYIGTLATESTATLSTSQLVTTHQYILYGAPTGASHAVYLYDVTAGAWVVPGGTRASKGPILSYLDGSATAIIAGGCPYFELYSGRTQTDAPQVARIRGGSDVMLPIDYYVELATDTGTVSTVLAPEGGTPPFAYATQRGGAGPFATIAVPRPGVRAYDTGLAPGETYTYQAVVTDSSTPAPVVRTSPPVTVTTLAPLGIVPPALHAPASPRTAWTNGATPLPNDTFGNPLNLHSPDGMYDISTGLVYFYGVHVNSTGVKTDGYCYATADGVNLTPVGVLPGGGGNPGQIFGATIGGTAYTFVARPKCRQGPGGLYYLYVHAQTTVPSTADYCLVGTSQQPYGPFSSWVSLQSGGISTGSFDIGFLRDMDGTGYLFYVKSTNTTATLIRLDPGWTTAAAYTPIAGPSYEGLAAFRTGRTAGAACSLQTSYTWNANLAWLAADLAGGVGTVLSSVPNAAIYTTPAQALAAPAGAASGTYTQDPGTGYGTAAGIDPILSYGSQSCSHLSLPSGQDVLLADRWANPPQDPPSAILMLPITYVNGLPVVVFAPAWTPQIQPPSGGGGPPTRNAGGSLKWFPGLRRAARRS